MNAKRMIFLLLVIVFVVLIFNNSAYYFSTKKMLTETLITRSEMIADQIRLSVEHTEEGSHYVEDLVGELLRTAAIAAQSELPSGIEQVDNAKLKELAIKLGIHDITLFKRVEGDIVGLKSSEPKEIGLSSKDWGYWFTAFQQLLDQQKVAIPEGQKLPNFWAGIYEVSAADTESVNKFGYYYDGSTDYIVNPYVKADKIVRYKELTGPERLIEKMVADNPQIVEISGFNGNTFGKPLITYQGVDGSTFVSVYDRPLLFGSYEYRDEQDKVIVARTMESMMPESVLMTSGERKLLKSYVPVKPEEIKGRVQRELPFVITVVSDYAPIEATLNKQLVNIGVMALLATVLSIGVLLVSSRVIFHLREKAVRTTQELYIEDLDKMFAIIRGQRHDFLNHVQTMFSMVTAGKHDALKRYAKELVEGLHEVNDMIRIGHPGIAALVQAKIAIALHKNIVLKYEFADFDRLTLGIKSVDIVKILGNLVDNAFDEVAKLEPEFRKVTLRGWVENNCLCFTVGNPLHTPLKDPASLFRSGYTTKECGHQGLGLALVKERLDYYKGSVETRYSDNHITFYIQIPLQ